jgi:hypothetical protein
MSKYKYKPLRRRNQIRILQLLGWHDTSVRYEAIDQHKGKDKSIYCRIITRNLPHPDGEAKKDRSDHDHPETPQRSQTSTSDGTMQGPEDNAQAAAPTIESDDEPYEAVSWTWGGDQNNESVFIEEGRGWKTIEVRSNLIAVLRQLRRKDASRSIWVDAVCINQNLDDNDNSDKAANNEKNMQVAMMAHIYGNAFNVCIWLGDHDDNSELALRFIQNTVSDLGVFEEITTTTKFSDEWTALGALMNRPWFGRRWVVQEISHAKTATVHCGKDWVQWSDFETAVSLFERDAARIAKTFHGNEKAEYSPDYFGDVEAMGATRLVQAKSKLFRRNDENQIVEYRYPLSDLVTELSNFEAGNAHDMIYAVLSLAKDTHHKTEATHRSAEAKDDASTPSKRGSRNKAARNKRKYDDVNSESPHKTNAMTDNASSSGVPTKKARVEAAGADRDSGRMSAKDSTEPAANYTVKETALAKWSAYMFQLNARKNHKVFKVDYKQEFFEVCKQFLDFTLKFPTGNNNLDILCRPWAPRMERSTLPSWIPTVDDAAFQVRPARFAPGGKQIARKNHDPLVCQSPTTTSSATSYNACGNQRQEDWKFGNTEDQKFSLFVWGFAIDEIGEIGPFSQLGNVPVEWLHLAGWQPWDHLGKRIPGTPPPERLWRTLVADRGPEGVNAKVYYPKAFEYAIDNSTPDTGLETTNLAKRSNPILVEFLKRMMAVVWNRKLFKSARHGGLLGLAPKKAKDKDRE